ncbi:serine hydrolase domain-containing protein [Leptolyngbya sp. PCC 6406]|uniref:serine hydrolase domain-containing protein n=1 Tax=Leptolyngbya sp. PCC 6406 TaxID=1173264 RepID=UPI0002AC2C31|nr:serine hydrolase domain-containing protein [Leptolyngbya sp. PCC 6406]
MKNKLLSLVVIMPLLAACGALEVEPESEAYSVDSGIAESSPNGAIAGQMSAQIDGLMAQFEDGPGGVVMVIQSGEIVHQNGYGLADIEQEIPITPETLFHLGSVGKQFTAMGILILVERGQVDLDDPISVYIPELRWMDSGVTVRRLLHHTSGVMGYDDRDDIYTALLALSPAPDNEDVLTALSQFQEMLADPGDEFHYSNTGYDILGLLIERISGQPYSRFMEANLFAPLGMANTFALPSDRRFGDTVAQSYDTSGPYESDVLDNVNGSGSIYSTLGDLYRYDQALYTEALVSQDLLAEMFTSGTLNDGEETAYGFGVEVATYSGYDYVGHQGSWLGFDSYYLRFPEESLSVVVLLNLDDAEPDAEETAFAIADFLVSR